VVLGRSAPLRTPSIGDKHGFANFRDALTDALSAVGISSGEADE